MRSLINLLHGRKWVRTGELKIPEVYQLFFDLQKKSSGEKTKAYIWRETEFPKLISLNPNEVIEFLKRDFPISLQNEINSNRRCYIEHEVYANRNSVKHYFDMYRHLIAQPEHRLKRHPYMRANMSFLIEDK